MKIIRIAIGLGNPGPEFQRTLHNAGFDTLDSWAAGNGLSFVVKPEWNALVAQGTVPAAHAADEHIDVVLVKPLTGMNDSGETARKVFDHFEPQVDTLPQYVLVYDDLAMPFGKLRFRDSGSAGGHRGVKSVIDVWPSQRLLPRLKVGIGPDPGGANRFNYVTRPLGDDLFTLFQSATAQAHEALDVWIRSGMSEAMNRFNGMK